MAPSAATPDLPEDLRGALVSADPVVLGRLLQDVRSPELLDVWSELLPEQRKVVFRALSPDKAAEIFSNLSPEEQSIVVQSLPVPRLGDVLEELSPDDLADALQALEARNPEHTAEVRAVLDPETLAVAASLSRYHRDEAGGIMTPKFISVRASMTAEQVLAFLRKAAPDAETIYYLYVVDASDRLCGVISLRDLIVCPRNVRVEEIMDPDVVSVSTDTDQEEVARTMADYDFSVLPVLEAEGQLKGIVTVDDVLDVVEEEATEDIRRLGAAPVDIDYVHANPWVLFRKRASWLILLVVSMTLTYNVISRYDQIIEEVVILAAFIPLLIGTGGNVGAQVATLVVRALATRELELADYVRVLWKELRTGILLGAAFGAFITAYVLIFHTDEPRIAVALGVTMVLISLTANLVGASMPFLLRKLGFDPALTSSPGITTVMDVLGLIIYFQVVIWILGPLLEGQGVAPPLP